MSFNLTNQTLKFCFLKFPVNIVFLKKIVNIICKQLQYDAEIEYFGIEKIRKQPNIIMDKLLDGNIDITENFCGQEDPSFEMSKDIMNTKIVIAFNRRKLRTIDDFLNILVLDKITFLIFGVILLFAVVYCIFEYFYKSKIDFSLAVFTSISLFFGFQTNISNLENYRLKVSGFAIMFLGIVLQVYYQGLIFQCLTVNTIDDKPKDATDILEGNYIIEAPFVLKKMQFFKEMVHAFNSLSINLSYVNKSTLELAENLKHQPYHFGALIEKRNLQDLLDKNIIDKQIHVLPQTIVRIPRCLYFQKHSNLKDIFDFQITLLKENGIIKKLLAENELRVIKETSKMPEQIIVKDMLLPFKILGYGLLLSLVCLSGEILVSMILSSKIRKRD